MATAFELVSKFQPAGDQPRAVEKLVAGFREGKACQTLLGATGTGKTFTASNVIAQVGKPTLVLAHNKTLAAQLYKEFRAFFPRNAVHYFVSYYDYYQPEAYIPQRDIYIEKDALINENIDRLRLAATSALVSREDVVIVASLNDSTWWSYEIGFPGAGQWLEVFNSDVYDNWVNPVVAGNGGQIYAGGGPLNGMSASASIVIPANGFLVFARDRGDH